MCESNTHAFYECFYLVPSKLHLYIFHISQFKYWAVHIEKKMSFCYFWLKWLIYGTSAVNIVHCILYLYEFCTIKEKYKKIYLQKHFTALFISKIVTIFIAQKSPLWQLHIFWSVLKVSFELCYVDMQPICKFQTSSLCTFELLTKTEQMLCPFSSPSSESTHWTLTKANSWRNPVRVSRFCWFTGTMRSRYRCLHGTGFIFRCVHFDRLWGFSLICHRTAENFTHTLGLTGISHNLHLGVTQLWPPLLPKSSCQCCQFLA